MHAVQTDLFKRRGRGAASTARVGAALPVVNVTLLQWRSHSGSN